MVSWLKCFTIDHENKATEVEIPFKILPPSQFDKEEFDKDHNYWRIGYTIFYNGNVQISASPGMSWYCVMLARWNDNGSFTLFKRAGYDMNMEVVADNAETEKYIENVIRPNFQRINEIKKWEYVEEQENDNLSLEGAIITYYYSGNGLEKTVANIFGETYKSVVESYFLNGRLSFIYEVTTRYGIPPMYREELLREGQEDVPDTKTERRWYLKGNTCIRGVGDNNKKLTLQQIEEEFLDGEWEGKFSLYTEIIGR